MLNPVGPCIAVRENLEGGNISNPPHPRLSVNLPHEVSRMYITNSSNIPNHKRTPKSGGVNDPQMVRLC